MNSEKKSGLYKNFINGCWSDGEKGKTYQVFSPGEKSRLVGNFPLSTEADVVQAVEAAHTCFEEWKELSPSERTDYIYRFIDILDEHKERLAEAAVLEQGKIYREALAEPVRGIKESRIMAGEALRLEGIVRPSDSKRTTNVAERVPIGVVAAITPWNFPILTPIRKIIPALAAGCTVVFKPATATPLTGIILAELFEKAGFPAGAVNLILGSGKEIGSILVGHPLVKGVTFTGSTEVGLSINRAAATTFTKVQLEMGGKNAALIMDYRNLEEIAPQIVKAAFTNAGQRCTSISRVIVHKRQAAKLEALILKAAKDIKIGHGSDPESDMGPLIDRKALDTMEEYITSAEKEGAYIATGGKALTGGIYDQGYYFEPTVITGVTTGMRVAREEIFGPILSILEVSSEEEMITACNSTQYGLTASVFSDNQRFCYDCIKKIDTGMVRINNLGVSGGNMPFGGSKKSGFGPFGIGSTTMDFYTNMKVIYIEY